MVMCRAEILQSMAGCFVCGGVIGMMKGKLIAVVLTFSLSHGACVFFRRRCSD